MSAGEGAMVDDRARLAAISASLGHVGHLIDGRIVRGAETFSVTAPWLGEELAACPSAGSEELEAAVRAARSAQPAWAARSDEDRGAVLRAFADAVEAAADRIGEIIAAETGKPFAAARGEMLGAAGHIRYHAAEEIPVEVVSDDETETIMVVHEPVGVVACITPWNGPVLMLANKIAAALRAGDTVVAKPSPYTPFSSLLLGEIAREVLPAGVVNILAGGDALGVDMTTHPGVDMVSFTGSVRAGQAIMAQSAPGLRRLQLELGGNDAAVVLPDVDIAEVAPRIYRGAFALSGQICAAIKRLYVHESIADELVAALAGIARSQRPGSPWDPQTTMGPSSTRPQYERVLGLIEDAIEQGAEVVTGGGALEGDGFFIAPTILRGVDRGVAVVDEEQFGPVLPVMTFTDIDEVLERVNGTDFGLGGSVWTDDAAKAMRIARRFQSGSTWINRHPHVGAHVPFGGIKLSGVGREGGPKSFESFTEPKTISILK